MGTVVSLNQVRNEDDGLLYPRTALHGLSTALAGFAAGFLGRQDCVWIADAGLTATCVDTDPARLIEMSGIYPDDWTFACDDIFEYARARYAEGATYDLVSLDPPTNLFERCASMLDLWCSLADGVVVIGIGRGTQLPVPDGWELRELVRRSMFAGGTYWVTLERL